jgi:hypothetical protein
MSVKGFLRLLFIAGVSCCPQQIVAQAVPVQVTPNIKKDLKIDYGEYAFSDYQVELKYPKGLLIQRNQQYEFVSGDSSVSIYAKVLENADNALWIQNYEQCLNNYKEKDVTFKVYKKEYFIITGIEDEKVFYQRQMPFEINGRKCCVNFEMRFPKTDKKTWDPILTACATSFKIDSEQPEKKKATIGWSENESDLTKYKLVKQAEKWLDEKYRFSDSSPDDCNQSGTNEGRKHKVDEKGVLFTDDLTEPTTQFVLSINDDYCGDNDGGIRGFALFTYQNHQLKGELLTDPHVSSSGGSEIIKVPKIGKILMLKRGERGFGYAEYAYLYLFKHGKMNEVLQYQKTKMNRMGDVESLLQPLDNGDLRLLVSSQKDEVQEGENDLEYTETIYHYEPNQGKFVETGVEKVLPYASGEAEWQKLNPESSTVIRIKLGRGPNAKVKRIRKASPLGHTISEQKTPSP